MPDSMRIDHLHQQYLMQAQWTKDIREYLLTLAGANSSSRILEAGCGTGAILQDLIAKANNVVGIDIEQEAISYARRQQTSAHLTVANVLQLPFPNAYFDITVFHYFLLWVANQNLAISEMIRVTKPTGVVIAFAEPDYPSRIDYPDDLMAIAAMQNLALEHKGADIFSGRKLRELFSTSGLKHVHFGVLGSLWKPDNHSNEFEFEWNYLNDDLSKFLKYPEIEVLKEKDWAARKEGRRVLYIPTFWAIGWV